MYDKKLIMDKDSYKEWITKFEVNLIANRPEIAENVWLIKRPGGRFKTLMSS